MPNDHQPTTASSDPTESKSVHSIPTKWWQWVFLYPSVVTIFVAAVPTFVELAQSIFLGVPYGEVAAAKRQNAAWNRNLECSAAAFDWLRSTETAIKVDATICKTGDVLVRYMAPHDVGGYRWLLLEEAKLSEGRSLKTAHIDSWGIIPQSLASEPTKNVQSDVAEGQDTIGLHPPSISGPLRQRSVAPSILEFVAQGGPVICQRMVDNTILKRRVQTPQGCFDEFVNTYTGQLLSRTPAPCESSC